MTKIHYPHSPSTGEALAPIPADPDRLAGQDDTGNWLRYFETDFASPDAPPAAGSHEVACRLMPDGAVARDFGAGAWVIKPDWRGHKYWPADATHETAPITITEVGVEPPEGYLTERPAAPPPEPPPPPTPAELTAAAQGAVQAALDAKARERQYDGILSLCTYATSAVPKFAAEGQAGVNWRDAAWGALYALLADIQAGNTPMPETLDAAKALALAHLPAMEWPA